MSLLLRSVSLALGLFLVIGCRSDSPPLQIDDAWVRLPPPGAELAAAYARIYNPGDQEIRIVAVQCECAGHVMIHSSREENGLMRMRAVDELVVPAGQRVTLAPGGLHIMLSGMTAPLSVDRPVELLWTLADGRQLRSAAAVRQP